MAPVNRRPEISRMVNWPLQVPAELNKFYGNPSGRNGFMNPAFSRENCEFVSTPWKLVTAWDNQPVKRFLFHSKCAEALETIFDEIWGKCDKSQNKIEAIGMHLFGGALNYRLMRGGNALSMHSWGCAIDFDPANNAFGSERMKMSPMVIAAFKRQGAAWGGDWKKKDGMHFQFAKV